MKTFEQCKRPFTFTIPHRFRGDGRKMIKALPGDVLEGTMPIPVRAATGRWMVERFNEAGRSVHSAQGATLWVILEHCRENKIHYRLHHIIGYEVIRLKSWKIRPKNLGHGS